ncbi:type II secretion system major pseudopilin GspG [Pararhodobacter marinus]|uniref:Type II secretion system core protein G n=1 Tax=Pararhodobacter marinus TaxID=2184063 RepID=A0A2U2C7D7_9RHOB|nr:type II secretion system major pseudopilin GspG [Pararhodobacter marinus]PWE27773.1 type II secretion system protein GspG [Pararhodobacter marinus]
MTFRVPFNPKSTLYTKKRRPGRRLRRDAGLTLIELMVVVVILALLAVVIVPRVIDRPDQARAARAQSDIAAIGSALNLYRLDTGSYPTTDQGLAALVSRPTVAPVPQNWADGGYLERVPEDPWGRAYLYLAPGVHGPYDLVSYGADGRSGGTGADADITSWQGE